MASLKSGAQAGKYKGHNNSFAHDSRTEVDNAIAKMIKSCYGQTLGNAVVSE